MNTQGRFTSSVRYEHERIHAAAVYCSDGRVGEHFDDFLTNGLGLPRYDRVALPGGPASLTAHEGARLEHAAVMDELKFLVEAHGLERVVLIQHDNCAFYASRLGLEGQPMADAQRADLTQAAAFVRRITGAPRVESYFAHLSGEEVWFETVALE